ncbi:MAG: D-glucuronyl C5-epimerase family protein [Actinomycetota bacterium]|nr:D-glucuronyl C5-epimerase family protein [Actinomycetota bacterium]
MRWTPIAGLATALLIALVVAPTASGSPVLTLRHDGSVLTREDRHLPPAQALEPAPRRSAAGARLATRSPATSRAKRKTVKGELERMLKAGAISRATHDNYRSTYFQARQTRSKLGGARRAALSATIVNLERVAAAGLLTVSRSTALFETVKRNRSWWSNGPLVGSGQRVTFQGSRLVWQHYAGQGLQIQWLGTFGKANALWTAKSQEASLRKLLDEALGLASDRAGGIAFEYLFRFGGGRPPWASGLAQGTAIQALSRAAVKLNEPRYIRAARRALGIFRQAPPAGVRVKIGSGAHYLIYSYTRGLRVLNAFAQALNGLYDFAALANDAEGRALFAQGERQLRKELPRYETVGWSRYSLGGGNADLGYHTLARDFLRNLCKRLEGESNHTGVSPKGATAPGAPVAPVLPGVNAGPYCSAADRFTASLTRDPALKLLSRNVRAGRPASVRFRVSKPSFVKIAIYRGGNVIAVMTARVAGGSRSLRWARPRRGTYQVKLRATDLAGNDGSADGELRVLARK